MEVPGRQIILACVEDQSKTCNRLDKNTAQIVPEQEIMGEGVTAGEAFTNCFDEMKIGILTQPLHSNYGGLLQAFALQQVLIGLGHNVATVNFCKKEYYKGNNSIYKRAKRVYNQIINTVFRKRYHYAYSAETDRFLEQNITPFINKHIKLTSPVSSPKELKRLYKASDFDAFIVGSDQVWRPRYSPRIEHFFLDFCRYGSEKKIAYAASFGVDEWEFSARQTHRCAALASGFDKISVREISAVKLCRKNLGIDAKVVLDPTFLLDRSVYENIVNQSQERKKDGDLFVYFLDRNGKYQQIVDLVSESLGLRPFTTMPRMRTGEITKKDELSECIYPSVESWLRSFMDAKFVVTDSFHGCVFSIIFNKPFLTIGNEQRGLSRFVSLLSQLDLAERLCPDAGSAVSACQKSIYWPVINEKLNRLRTESINFLKEI